jgi:prepilin-type processing-associated H-X9-DG protein
MWWAPVDRQGKTAGLKIDFNIEPRNIDRPGLLAPYVKNFPVFRCPDYEGQVGYAMSFIHGGPMGESDSRVSDKFPDAGRIMVVWDHRNGPGCGGAAVSGGSPSERPPFTPVTGPDGGIHYPPRHNGSLNILFYDGHAASKKPSTFRDSDFRAPGSPPPANPPLPP